jgi:AcrR family transcriptional regulator
MGIPERKQRELARREQDILQAALRLFAEEDWQLVTIERIAQEAEIGKGTVYLHFPSKEDLCGRLALDFAQQLLARLREIDPSLPVVEKLRAAIHVFFAAHGAGNSYHRVVEYCSMDDFRRRLRADCRAELDHIDGEIAALIHRVLQQGIAEGVFARRPLPVLLFGAQATLVGAVRMVSHSCLGTATPEEHEEEVARFVLAGLMYMDRVDAEHRPAAAEGQKGRRQLDE